LSGMRRLCSMNIFQLPALSVPIVISPSRRATGHLGIVEETMPSRFGVR